MEKDLRELDILSKEEYEKLKEVINHKDNNQQHLRAISTYIQLFYDKWKEQAKPYVEEITNHHINLLEKVTK